MTLAEFNAMPEEGAVALLRECCGVEAWARDVAGRRPFPSRPALLEWADAAWRRVGPARWREVFAHHPRIGERPAAATTGDRARAWSAGEQAAASRDAGAQGALSDAQREYERRFGHIYLVCAAGLTAGEILADLRRRLENDADAELAVAAEEQRRITRLRLERLLTTSSADDR